MNRVRNAVTTVAMIVVPVAVAIATAAPRVKM